ncbi:tetratricopeptide repeat protein [Candidatus Woesearchaeota archaeon]|nr:tetratricopeptide repeat protein [Candidatus Woesearchaeota archaeon]
MTDKPMLPWDRENPELETEETTRLKDRHEFSSELEWITYQSKVFYEGFRDINAATKILEDGLKKYPDQPDLLLGAAECLSRDKSQLKKALSYCQRGLKKDPDSDYGHTIKARIELAQEKPIDAYISAMNALKINSQNVEAGVYLGTIGFAIAEAEGNVEEMEYSIENLRITQRLCPGSKRIERIIAEDEKRLREYKR